MRKIYGVPVLAAVFVAGYLAGSARDAGIVQAESAPAALLLAAPAAEDRVFELRTYTAPEGKFEDLQRRFRDHTMRLFERHGISNIGYWIPQDPERSHNTLIYVVAHPSREAARENWAAFAADPEWRRVAQESQADGRIIERLESVYMDPTDYSPMR